jgi:hypothetical protein
MHPHIHEEADTVTLRDVMRVSVRIYLNAKAGHSTSATLKDVLFLNFPAVRDIHQLRGLLTGTPLCEILGSSRSAIHRQGTLIDFGALDGQRDLAEATRVPLPSHVDTPLLGERTDGTDGDTWCIFECSGDVKTADGTQDQERASGPGVPLSLTLPPDLPPATEKGERRAHPATRSAGLELLSL